MNITRILTEEYGLQNINWNHNNPVIETSVGRKRVTYWRDRKLLEYHLNFRDRLFSKSGILCNRMIRTRHGQSYVHTDNFLLTLHDAIDLPFQKEDDPEFKGFLLASLLEVGNELAYANHEASLFPYKETIKALQNVRQRNHRYFSMLVTLIPEVKKRLTSARSIAPTLFEGNEMKEVMGQFYYDLSDSPPQPAYHLARQALNGFEKADDLQACWSSLLSALPDHLHEQVRSLLILPWEWRGCIMAMQLSNEDDVYYRFEKEWEATVRICETLGLSVPARRTFSYE